MRQRYIQSFNTAENVQAAIDDKLLGKPYAALIHDGHHIDWNSKGEEIDYRTIPITFDIISAGTINWKAQKTSAIRTIEYSLNDGPWTSFPSTTAGAILNVVAGDKVSFRGTNSTYGTVDKASRFSSSTCVFNLKGNIMSLIDKDNYASISAITDGTNNFWAMFFATNVVDASNLWLPDKATNDCFYYLFKECKQLQKAPQIGHSNFTPGSVSYRYMFEGCSKLNYIKCLFNQSPNVFKDWVKGVASTGTFVKHPNATWTTGVNGIPTGWTVIDAE